MKTRVVIFSMDRALQCDSLVQSLQDNARNLDEIAVIWRATSDLHEATYRRLFTLHRDVLSIDQPIGRPLGECVFAACEGADAICINVDDQIYYRPVDFERATYALTELGAFVYSWRLGHTPGVTEWLRLAPGWFFHGVGHPHYGYLWHSDGAVYRTVDYLAMLDEHGPPRWRTDSLLVPNDLETMPAVMRQQWGVGKLHVGPVEAACMTWQINKEISTTGRFGAPWHEIPGLTDLESLARVFLDGARVDNQILYADRSWTRRFQAAGAFPTHVTACEAASRFYASCIR